MLAESQTTDEDRRDGPRLIIHRPLLEKVLSDILRFSNIRGGPACRGDESSPMFEIEDV